MSGAALRSTNFNLKSFICYYCWRCSNIQQCHFEPIDLGSFITTEQESIRVLRSFQVYEMDWGFVHKAWDKWASPNIGSDKPLKAAILINYDPTGPSRLLSTIAEEEGIKVNPIELSQFIDFIKCDKLQTESFIIGPNQYIVTSIHENWFCARCMNTSKSTGEGAIVMHTAAFLLVALYDGSIGSASRAMVAVDQFAWQLTRKNL